jgi:hypothetical protein
VSRGIRILVDCSRASPSETYSLLAEGVPSHVLLLLTSRAVRELRQELHTWERVGEWAAELATRLNRPVALNLPDRDGSSRTMVLAPNWSHERLAGYVAGRHEELEAEFGPIARVGGAA